MTSARVRDPDVALVPDRFAAYRLPLFRRLSQRDKNGFRLTIYADTREDIPGLKLAPTEFCGPDPAQGGISWMRIRNFAVRRICFWQTGLIRLAFSNKHQVHIYWGEAHRLSTWASAIISRLRGKRVVFWTHGLYGNEGCIKKWIRLRFYRLAHTLLLYGHHARDLLAREGFPENSLYVIKNSLDTELQTRLYETGLSRARQAREQLFPQDTGNTRVLVFVGRLEAAKRLDLALLALRHLRQHGAHRPYRLLLIGDGSQRQALATQARELGIEGDVCFYGPCYEQAELAPLIMMADVCISPGEVGLTAMQALAYGTPVVTHDDFTQQMPEFEAIIPGRSGAFFQRGSVENLCEKIDLVIQQKEAGQITQETCREPISKGYNPDSQCAVFKQMLASLT